MNNLHYYTDTGTCWQFHCRDKKHYLQYNGIVWVHNISKTQFRDGWEQLTLNDQNLMRVQYANLHNKS